jgi:hypothetical protein
MRRLGRLKITLILAAPAAIILLWLYFRPASLFQVAREEIPSAPVADQAIERFLATYWRKPIPPQGKPPAEFSPIEASLEPEACGSCHQQQYQDWKQSLHSRAMGPGPWGQIVDLFEISPQDAVPCMTCHAPLTEQLRFLAQTTGSGKKENPHFIPSLELRGITCAACHVRNHARYGPPETNGAAKRYPADMARHGGVERTPYFERAEFCRDCHQFDPANTVLVNGKPLQDTYREWQTSSWGKAGAACQECHMPSRRHLWKGIHDRDWVRDGVRFETRLEPTEKGSRAPVKLFVELHNSAVGHKFPTYITPKVFVRAALLNDNDAKLPGTEQERVVGWDVRFEGGNWVEYFDTRVAAGDKFQGVFSWSRSRAAKKLRVWIEVHPDHFYHVHFYPAYLRDQNPTPAARELIGQAIAATGQSRYVLFDKTLVLD